MRIVSGDVPLARDRSTIVVIDEATLGSSVTPGVPENDPVTTSTTSKALASPVGLTEISSDPPTQRVSVFDCTVTVCAIDMAYANTSIKEVSSKEYMLLLCISECSFNHFIIVSTGFRSESPNRKP
jgi:hypothetical protein